MMQATHKRCTRPAAPGRCSTIQPARGHFSTPRTLRGDVCRTRALEMLVTPQVVMDAAAVTNATYVTLGLTAVTFLGTFFVAPRFKRSFKEEIDWRDVYRELSRTGVPAVTPAEAYSKRKSCALLDVRLANKYSDLHAAGSVSIPLYIPIQNWDIPSIIRRVGFAFFGIYGTELNTNFVEDVSAQVPKARQVILICENGGSLQNKSGTMFGFQSRSLKAAYYLQQAGYKVSYVQGGVAQWASDGLPLLEGADPADNDDDGGSDGESDRQLVSAGVGGLQQLLSSFGR